MDVLPALELEAGVDVLLLFLLLPQAVTMTLATTTSASTTMTLTRMYNPFLDLGFGPRARTKCPFPTAPQ